MAKVKKNISIEEDILKKGLERAELLGYNFSSYITFLINLDTNNLELKSVNIKDEKALTKDDSNIDDDVLSEADNILNI